MATFLEQATFYGVEWGCSPGLESSPAPALLGRKTSQVQMRLNWCVFIPHGQCWYSSSGIFLAINEQITEVNLENKRKEVWSASDSAVEGAEEAVSQGCFRRIGLSPCVFWQHVWQKHYTLLIGSSSLICPASSNRLPSCPCITMLPSALTRA